MLALMVCCCLFSMNASGAFRTTDVVYENHFNAKEADTKQLSKFRVILPDAGEKGDGVLWIKNPNYKFNNVYYIPLNPALFADGGFYVLEARYRGENLKKGERHYFGPGLSLRFSTRSQGKKTRWKGGAIQMGNPNWSSYYYVEKFNPKDVAEIGININNHMGSGDYFIDWVRISKAVEIPDDRIVPPVNQEAKKIPSGRSINDPDSLKTYQGPVTKYRGFQVSPNKVAPEDIRDLGDWGANLIRFCFSGNETINSEEEFLKWVDVRIKRLDALMPQLKKSGVKVAIAFGKVPGAKTTNYASVNLRGNADFGALEKAWKKVALHYRNNSQIYGYDLLNEPYGINSGDWHKVAEQLIKAIRPIDPDTPIIDPYCNYVFKDRSVIYSPHIYDPHTLTHQGVSEKSVEWQYPGYINGVYWDKEQLRVFLKPVIEFQRKNNARIYIGEFSCIVWAKGRDAYIRDCIELFEEYGWDWTYHAFREWAPWSVEHERSGPFKFRKAKQDTPAKQVLLKYFKQNKKTSGK